MKTILIADDDTAILDAITLILEAEGFHVLAARGGRSIDKLIKYHPQLVLLDLRMSGKDGTSICRELKNQEQTRSIPVILISAHQELETFAQECGADGWLRKPFEMEQLLAMVKKYIKD